MVLRLILVGGTAARLWSSLSSLLRSNIRFLLSSESERINWSASLAGLDSWVWRRGEVSREKSARCDLPLS